MSRFNEFYEKNYYKLKDACEKVCQKNKEAFDEDVFHDTYSKIIEIIGKKGKLDDETDAGMSNYYVRSYVNNSRMRLRYSYVKKRDLNNNEETLKDKLEATSALFKLRQDLYVDFTTLYLLKAAEHMFPPDDFNLFKMKFLCGMTYKQIQAKFPNERKIRNRILTIKNWLKTNISKKEVDNAFTEEYGFLI